jgi:hydrogenase-4 component E
MNLLVDLIIIAIIFMNLMMLSSSSISTCIRIAAVQGIFIGWISFIIRFPLNLFAPFIYLLVNIGVKGFIFPWLLFRAQQQANIKKEVEPIGGYPLSLLMGVGMFLISYWLSFRLPYPHAIFSNIVVPVAFMTFFTGAFIIIFRMKALTQVIGYLVLENGIYLFGTAFLVEQPLLIELAILLDIFVAVFVMGIAIFHISREFDHIDTQNLSQLKDWQ